MDRVTTRPRRSGDGGIVDETFDAMEGTPAKAAYDRAIRALTSHLQSDQVGFELLTKYEEAVINRLDLAIRLSQRPSVLPRAFGGDERTVAEAEFDRHWELVRAILGVDHLREADELADAADARTVEAYGAGIRRGLGQLAKPGTAGEIDPAELLADLAEASLVIAQHLHDLKDRL